MRNLDECRAEIFLRSEQRIRRNRTMGIRAASLFLLCIVSVVCVATVFPALFVDPLRDGANGASSEGNFVNLKAEILGTNYRKTVEENADVVALRQAVEDVFSAADGGISGGMDNGSVPGLPPLDEGFAGEGFAGEVRITFFERGGTQTVYVLFENVLRNECTGEEVFLTTALLRRLAEALGVDSDPSSVSFDAQYIRTDGADVGGYPQVCIIRSVEELRGYREEKKHNYFLGHRERVASDTTIGFADACEKYDEAYFKDRILIMVLLRERSGSIRHEVLSVEADGEGTCCIHIARSVPDCFTEDMALWHLLIEPEVGFDIFDAEKISVTVDAPTLREDG